jgi:hypothetical protein
MMMMFWSIYRLVQNVRYQILCNLGKRKIEKVNILVKIWTENQIGNLSRTDEYQTSAAARECRFLPNGIRKSASHRPDLTMSNQS